MKKILSVLLLAFSLVMSSSAYADLYYPTYTTKYPDVDYLDKYAESIYHMTSSGVFSGYPDGTFQPDKLINRAELVKILVELEYYGHDKEYYVDKKCFSDVPANEWYTKYVCFAKDKGQIHGYPDGTFKPEQNVNLVEALTMYLSIRIYGHDIEPSTPWYKSYVEEAGRIIPHDFTAFDQMVTRAQMANLLARTHTDLAYMDLGLGFLWETVVTYETLENNINVEDFARSTDHIKSAPYFEYVNYDDGSEYAAVLYSENAVILPDPEIDDECYTGYFEGDFNFAIVNTLDGEINQLVSETNLGNMRAPENALFKADTDMGSWMLVENYASCIDSLFTIYEPGNNYYTYPSQVEISETEDDWFYADSAEDVSFGDGVLEVIHGNEPLTYQI